MRRYSYVKVLHLALGVHGPCLSAVYSLLEMHLIWPRSNEMRGADTPCSLPCNLSPMVLYKNFSSIVVWSLLAIDQPTVKKVYILRYFSAMAMLMSVVGLISFTISTCGSANTKCTDIRNIRVFFRNSNLINVRMRSLFAQCWYKQLFD